MSTFDTKSNLYIRISITRENYYIFTEIFVQELQRITKLNK